MAALPSTAPTCAWATIAVSILPGPGSAILIPNCDNGRCGKLCQETTTKGADGVVVGQGDWADKVGKSKVFGVTGLAFGDVAQVWGAGPYLAESLVDEATVHAGLLKSGEDGYVTVTCVPEPDRYPADISNGITTQLVNSKGQYQFPLKDAPRGAFILEAYTGEVPEKEKKKKKATPPPTTAAPRRVAAVPTPKQKPKPKEDADGGDVFIRGNNGNTDDDSVWSENALPLLAVLFTFCLLLCVLGVAVIVHKERQKRDDADDLRMLGGMDGASFSSAQDFSSSDERQSDDFDSSSSSSCSESCSESAFML